MKNSIIFSVVLIVTQCEGHSLLGGILSGAKDIGAKVHGAIHGVAQGLHLETHAAGYQYQYNRPGFQQHQPVPPNNGGNNQPHADTIIVIIEEEAAHPGPPPYGHGRPPLNHHNRPQNHQYNGNGNYNGNQNSYGNPNQNNNGNYKPNMYGNQHSHNNENLEQNTYLPPNYGNPNTNNYGNTNNEKPNTNNYGNPNKGKPNTYDFENTNQNNYGNNQNGATNPPFGISTTKPEMKPSYGTVYDPSKEINQKPTDYSPNVSGNDKQESTKKPEDDDFPLFVPLKPNQYADEVDKSKINSPKREAEKEDEFYPIDVRFGKNA